MQQYTDMMITKMSVCIIIMMVFLILLCGIAVCCVKFVAMGQKLKLLGIVGCALSVCVVIAIGGKINYEYYLDIKNQSFITYEGKVEIGTYFGFGPVAQLCDAEATRLGINRWLVDSGTGIYNNVSLIYAEHSKTVLSWERKTDNNTVTQ